MKKIFSVIIFFTINTLASAAPATHVYFAQVWMEKNKPQDQEALIAGTLFPDIRYLGTISRQETHEKNVTPKQILKTSEPFKAGMRIHAFVDEKREAFIKVFGIDQKLDCFSKNAAVLLLKLIEDEILWDSIDKSRVIDLMGHLFEQEKNFSVDEQTLLKWHEEMRVYFKQPPSQFIQQLAAKNKGFLHADAETIKSWAELFPSYVKDPLFICYTLAMVDAVSRQF